MLVAADLKTGDRRAPSENARLGLQHIPNPVYHTAATRQSKWQNQSIVCVCGLLAVSCGGGASQDPAHESGVISPHHFGTEERPALNRLLRMISLFNVISNHFSFYCATFSTRLRLLRAVCAGTALAFCLLAAAMACGAAFISGAGKRAEDAAQAHAAPANTDSTAATARILFGGAGQ